jgi:hypothetical protein
MAITLVDGGKPCRVQQIAHALQNFCSGFFFGGQQIDATGDYRFNRRA